MNPMSAPTPAETSVFELPLPQAEAGDKGVFRRGEHVYDGVTYGDNFRRRIHVGDGSWSRRRVGARGRQEGGT